MSYTAYKRGPTDTERDEIAHCLSCSLPECVGARYMACAIFDPRIATAEYMLELRSQVTRAVRAMRAIKGVCEGAK